ncbi:MAG TPA: hypothetical protein VLF43_00965 [Candidatus Saccharimonadales bacterium]|nr:hypothetical protein [Candidatus Saccharimonadales bacterium]
MTSVEGGVSPEIFTIRAHHADMIASALRGDPIEAYPTHARANAQFGSTANHRGGFDYYRDVYGETSEQANKPVEASIRLVKDFLALEPDAPVIAGSARDVLCNSCFIGEHCDRAIATDSAFVKGILLIAEKRGIGEYVTPFEQTVELRNGSEVNAPAVSMSAAIARVILSDRTYEARTTKNFLLKGLRLAYASIKS